MKKKIRSVVRAKLTTNTRSPEERKAVAAWLRRQAWVLTNEPVTNRYKASVYW